MWMVSDPPELCTANNPVQIYQTVSKQAPPIHAGINNTSPHETSIAFKIIHPFIVRGPDHRWRHIMSSYEDSSEHEREIIPTMCELEDLKKELVSWKQQATDT